MSIPRNRVDILSEHTTLDVEPIDRRYLNLYGPLLQRGASFTHFWQSRRGHRFASGTQGPR